MRAVAAVMKIETALAQARLSRVALRDPAVRDHAMSFAELKALAPHFDWDQEFALLAVGKEGHINVPQPKLMAAFDNLLTTVPLEEWRAYLHWQLLNGEATSLAAPFDEEHFAFYGTTLTGAKEQRPRWQRCVIATDRNARRGARTRVRGSLSPARSQSPRASDGGEHRRGIEAVDRYPRLDDRTYQSESHGEA